MSSVVRDAVVIETRIDAAVEVVWRYLTAERATWWPEMSFQAAAGAPLVETWTENGVQATATGWVTQCDEPQLLAFNWTEPGWLRPLNVSIRLTAHGPSTLITLTEIGFSRATTSPSLPAEHEDGWRHHLTRLKRICEADACPNGH